MGPDGGRGATIVPMPPRIAIPVPHSDRPGVRRAGLPTVRSRGRDSWWRTGAHPFGRVTRSREIDRRLRCGLVARKQSRYGPGEVRWPRATPRPRPADPMRDAIDDLLLRDAYNLSKPILGICYGLQTLNVYRGGTLLQHIESPVNHEAGREVPIAHTVDVDPGSKLGRIVFRDAEGKRFRRGQLESSSISGRNRRRTPRRGPMSAGWNHRSVRGNISRSLCPGRAMAPRTFSRRGRRLAGDFPRIGRSRASLKPMWARASRSCSADAYTIKLFPGFPGRALQSFPLQQTTACAIAALSVPMPSGVLAFTPTQSAGIPSSSATWLRIAAACGPIFGAARIRVESRLTTA